MFSLVVPTYNERFNIGPLVGRIEAVLKQERFGFEIFLVDDNSPDETWRLAQGMAKENPCLHVIRREGARGLATAVVDGWKAARGDILGVMDADLQDPPELILEMAKKWKEGYEVVFAVRKERERGVLV